MTEDEGRRVLLPQYGTVTPVAVPAAVGAVGIAAGLATANDVALWVGAAVLALGIPGGAVLAVGRAANEWPRSVPDDAAVTELLDDHRPARADHREALASMLGGGALFAGGLLPLLYVRAALGREAVDLGFGLPDSVAWIVVLALMAGTTVALFVGARTVGIGLDRLAVDLARELAFRRASEGRSGERWWEHGEDE